MSMTFMKSESSNTSDTNRQRLNITDQIDLGKDDKSVAL